MRLELVVFYLLFSAVTAVSLAALWRRPAARQARLRRTLPILLVVGLVGLLSGLFLPEGAFSAIIGLQLLAWGLYLWGIALDWRLVGAAFFLLVALLFLPGSVGHGVLLWGLLTAVLLTLYHTLTSQPVATIPIYAPGKTTPYPQPVGIRGDLADKTIQAQRPILECLTDGLILSNDDGHILYANQAAAFLIGREAATLVGLPVTEILVHLPMLAAPPASDNNSSHTQRRYPERFKLNGRIIQGRMTVVYDQAGVAQGTLALLRDVTGEHQAEQSRDAFLSTISHELRTPLTAIKGYTELLNSGAGGALNSNQKKFVETIQRNVSRMVHLINSMIFATAVKSGRLEFTSDHANLPQIVQQIVREFLPRAEAGGQTIQIRLDEQVGVIQADPIHIATMLEELLSNAIKYNKNEGEIVLRAVLQADENVRQQFVLMSIQDEGIGINPEDRHRIFEEFVHLDKDEIQIRAGGVGMGLTVVRTLVEAYNGRLWFESAPAAGSTFYILLPVKQPDASALWQTLPHTEPA